jgi:asparaginyl-tRNA synthetase
MDLDGLMELAENFISHIVQSVLKNRAPELQVIGRDPEKLKSILPPFPRLRYDEAAEMLNQAHKDGTWSSRLSMATTLARRTRPG